MLFISGKTTDGGATYQSNITGEICLAHAGTDDEEEDDDGNQ